MTVDIADRTRTVFELVEVLAEALPEVERWPGRADWDVGELTLTLTSWTARVDVVSRALAAIDDHWRLAAAIVTEGLSDQRHGLTIRELIDRTPGLVIVEVSRGSLRARLHGEFRKSPIATLAACVVLFGGVTTAIEFWSDEGRPTERCDIAITAPVSDEATNLSMDALAHLPAGCSVKIDLRATTPSGSQAGVSRGLSRGQNPHRKLGTARPDP